MRFTGLDNVFYVEKALKKVKKITIQTTELSERMYCKYGRCLKRKTKIVPFPLNPEIFSRIEKIDPVEVIAFKKKLGVLENKKLIGLGHNGFPENNHLKMIEELSSLPQVVLDDCVFILHISYGCEKNYIESLNRAIENSPKMKFILITKYFGPSEISLLRASIDILIHLPETDALSAAMTETLFSGNEVITGSWLPYGILRRNEIYFNSIEDFSELKNTFSTVLKEKNIKERSVSSNRDSVKSFLLNENIPKEWVKLFDSI